METVRGTTQIVDDCWHFAIGTYDGALLNIYVDGKLEGSVQKSGLISVSAAPFNIGGYAGNGVLPNYSTFSGMIDETFITSEILSAEQVRNLYCKRIPHDLTILPTRYSLNIHRYRKGAALSPAPGHLLVTPLRLYNFSAGSLSNEGSNGASGNLTNVGSAFPVAGIDGVKDNAFNLNGAQRLVSTDAGLPSGVSDLFFGCWVKTSNAVATMYVMTWGTTNGTDDIRLYIQSGQIICGCGSDLLTGPIISDGKWHFISVVHEPSKTFTGAKRHLYVDGKEFDSSDTLSSIVLGGANKFCIGTSLTSTNNLIGQVDTIFITNYVPELAEIGKLYEHASQNLPPKPLNPEDYIIAATANDLLVDFSSLNPEDKVDLLVA